MSSPERPSALKSTAFPGVQRRPAPSKGGLAVPGGKSKVPRHESNRKTQLTMRGKGLSGQPERMQVLEADDRDRHDRWTALDMFNVKQAPHTGQEL